MDKKVIAVVSYITWIGWIAALLLRDKSDSFVRRHLNNALILNLASLVAGILGRMGGILGMLSNILSLAIFVLLIIGIVYAVQGKESSLPLIGDITLVQ